MTRLLVERRKSSSTSVQVRCSRSDRWTSSDDRILVQLELRRVFKIVWPPFFPMHVGSYVPNRPARQLRSLFLPMEIRLFGLSTRQTRKQRFRRRGTASYRPPPVLIHRYRGGFGALRSRNPGTSSKFTYIDAKSGPPWW